ncbi:MAG TPA: nitroreductase family protein [Candidatus Agathobaculum merdavium]|nr:nitroreductase family protein [Candidatus Agathobaculum merdavium]
MEALECIKTRRSVRKFTEQPVDRALLEQVVAAAAYAPSWKNTQIARYTVVTDPAKKQRLADECMMDFAFNQKTSSHAPALVVVTAITGRSGYERDGSFSTSQGTHWQSFDAGVAAQTFCLAAHALGLGTVIMGIFDESKVRAVLDLPAEQMVSAIIAIGHPAEQPVCPKRKDVDTLLQFV